MEEMAEARRRRQEFENDDTEMYDDWGMHFTGYLTNGLIGPAYAND